MKRKSMPEGRKNRVRGRMTGRLCGLLIVAMLAGGISSGAIVSTYAAQAAGAGSVGKNTQGGLSGVPKDDESGGAADDTGADVTDETGAEGKEDSTNTDGAKDENKPTPDAEEEADPRPTPTKEPEDTKNEEAEGDPEEATPTPTPTKKPKKTPTPTPEGEEPDISEGEDPDPEEGDPEETAPTPTQKPKKTPTPTPEEEPDISEGEEPDVTQGEEDGEEEGEAGTPTPVPTKKPSSSSWVVPTESDDARYQYILGIDSTVITIDNPPAGYKSAAEAAKNMKTITIPIWKMTASGRKYTSSAQLTVNKKLANNVQQIFKEIYALDIKFPIKVVIGYTYRKVGAVGLSNSRIMSIHSFGAAIDINPGDYDNDYFLGKGNDLRDKSNPYCIPDEVIEIFEKYGWFWGGNFEICADTMHFQYFELGMLTYQGNSPFRTLKVKSGYMSGVDVRSLQQRLCELGFTVSIDGVYGSKTANAVQKYQKSRGLEATGEVDYKTWETIINETHYMPYLF